LPHNTFWPAIPDAHQIKELLMTNDSTFIQISVMGLYVVGLALFALWMDYRQAEEQKKA
jgi:hypothetical protein